jgi:hypothetical protein
MQELFKRVSHIRMRYANTLKGLRMEKPVKQEETLTGLIARLNEVETRLAQLEAEIELRAEVIDLRTPDISWHPV